MVWVMLDDKFTEHPKVAAAGPIGVWVHLQGLCYANRNLTDGFIPFSIAQSFGKNGTEHIGIATGGIPGMAEFGHDVDEDDWPEILIKCGLWEEAEGGYQIHDFLDFNPSREQVLAKRASWARRQKSHRESRRDSRQDSPVESHEESQVSHASPVSRIPYPVPKENTNTSRGGNGQEKMNGPDLARLGKGDAKEAPSTYTEKITELTIKYGHPLPAHAIAEFNEWKKSYSGEEEP